MKINSIDDLRAEIANLNADATVKLAVIKNDIELIKKEFTGLELFNKASEAIVPEALRHSRLINGPINFIAKLIFKEPGNVVNEESDRGKGNQIRNVALSVLESAATFLVTRYIRKKF
jgi:hypothetical protein